MGRFVNPLRPTARALPSNGNWGAEVVHFSPGHKGGFNGHRPEVVTGPVRLTGGYDRLLEAISLGQGGEIGVRLKQPAYRGVRVFENGLGDKMSLNPEIGDVSVSSTLDGPRFRLGEAGHRVDGDILLFQGKVPPRTPIRYVWVKAGDSFNNPSASSSTRDGFDFRGVLGF